jgi:DNA replication protein DnaC
MKVVNEILSGQLNPKTFERDAECATHGAYRERGGSFTGDFHRTIWFGCSTCNQLERQRADVEEREKQERARQARIESRMKASGVPLAFRDRTFDNFIAETPEQHYALDTAREFAENFWTDHLKAGNWLVFGGNKGTGKSHLALAIVQHVLRHSTGMYMGTGQIIRRVRATWHRDSAEREEDVMQDLGNRLDLLAIDELGVQRGTEDEQAILFEIINRRYADLRPTILMTNLAGPALKEFVGARAMDRIYERAVMVPFMWESHRRK